MLTRLRNYKGDDYLQLNDIISHCQLGDLECFEELYKLYYRKAFGTAYNISGQKGLAEDIAQEAFIICYKSIKHLKNSQTFNTWFYRIVVRVSWKIVKEQNNSNYDNFTNDLDRIGISRNTSDASIEEMASNLLIKEKIQALKLPLKTVLILYYYNDMSVKEISKVLDCFEGTVKSRLFKARRILLGELAPYYKDTFKNFDLNEKEVHI